MEKEFPLKKETLFPDPWKLKERKEMSVGIGLHGDSFDANVTEYFDSESPFVTFEIASTDVRKDYYSPLPGGGYRENKVRTGNVSVFIRSIDDAMRIFEAARKLVASVQDLEFDQKLKNSLKEEIESFFKPEDL